MEGKPGRSEPLRVNAASRIACTSYSYMPGRSLSAMSCCASPVMSIAFCSNAISAGDLMRAARGRQTLRHEQHGSVGRANTRQISHPVVLPVTHLDAQVFLDVAEHDDDAVLDLREQPLPSRAILADRLIEQAHARLVIKI